MVLCIVSKRVVCEELWHNVFIKHTKALCWLTPKANCLQNTPADDLLMFCPHAREGCNILANTILHEFKVVFLPDKLLGHVDVCVIVVLMTLLPPVLVWPDLHAKQRGWTGTTPLSLSSFTSLIRLIRRMPDFGLLSAQWHEISDTTFVSCLLGYESEGKTWLFMFLLCS